MSTILSIFLFILAVALIGWGLQVVNKTVDMAPAVKTFLNIAVVILLIFALIWMLGLTPYLEMPFPRTSLVR